MNTWTPRPAILWCVMYDVYPLAFILNGSATIINVYVFIGINAYIENALWKHARYLLSLSLLHNAGHTEAIFSQALAHDKLKQTYTHIYTFSGLASKRERERDKNQV